MRDRFISQQVCMLLDRMDTHPEEFAKKAHLSQFGGMSTTRWAYVIESGEFNLLEKFLLKRKLHHLRRKATQTLILDTFLQEAQEREQGPNMSTTSRFSNTNLTHTLTKEQVDALVEAHRSIL